MACDLYCRCGSCISAAGGVPRRGLRAVPLSVLLAWTLSGCALLQPPAPPPAPVVCDQQDREIVRLQQTLAEKDTEIQQLRAQQHVQAKVLKETTGEVARAEVKLRRLATQADAASQLAEVEVALQGPQAQAHPRRAAAQLAQAQHILDAGAASFAQGDYGAAVELAAQSQEIIDMVATVGPVGRTRGGRAVSGSRYAARAHRLQPACASGAHGNRTGCVRQGAPVLADAYRGEWLRVRTEDGRAGWVFGPLLEAPHPAAE